MPFLPFNNKKCLSKLVFYKRLPPNEYKNRLWQNFIITEPKPPQYINATSPANDRILVDWGPAVPTYGRITGYRLTYEQQVFYLIYLIPFFCMNQ